MVIMCSRPECVWLSVAKVKKKK